MGMRLLWDTVGVVHSAIFMQDIADCERVGRRQQVEFSAFPDDLEQGKDSVCYDRCLPHNVHPQIVWRLHAFVRHLNRSKRRSPWTGDFCCRWLAVEVGRCVLGREKTLTSSSEGEGRERDLWRCRINL